MTKTMNVALYISIKIDTFTFFFDFRNSFLNNYSIEVKQVKAFSYFGINQAEAVYMIYRSSTALKFSFRQRP